MRIRLENLDAMRQRIIQSDRVMIGRLRQNVAQQGQTIDQQNQTIAQLNQLVAQQNQTISLYEQIMAEKGACIKVTYASTRLVLTRRQASISTKSWAFVAITLGHWAWSNPRRSTTISHP